jgi:hypothetical protein
MPEWLIFCVVKRVEYSKLKSWYFYNIKLIILLALVYVINYIKAQRLRWFGHVLQMTNDRMVKQLYEWKLICTRLAGRPKVGWGKDVKDLRIIKKK